MCLTVCFCIFSESLSETSSYIVEVAVARVAAALGFDEALSIFNSSDCSRVGIGVGLPIGKPKGKSGVSTDISIN